MTTALFLFAAAFLAGIGIALTVAMSRAAAAGERIADALFAASGSLNDSHRAAVTAVNVLSKSSLRMAVAAQDAAGVMVRDEKARNAKPAPPPTRDRADEYRRAEAHALAYGYPLPPFESPATVAASGKPEPGSAGAAAPESQPDPGTVTDLPTYRYE